jgi:hypothetical protein
MRHPFRILSLLGLLACLADGAVAARFPDSVHHTFVVEGGPARDFSAFFGIALNQEAILDFPTFGTVTMSSDQNYRGDASNRIRFSNADGKWRVTLGDNWYDNTTGSSRPVPRYSFLSPFIDPRLTVDNGWGTLLRQLRVQLPERKEHAAIVSHIHTDEDASPFLDVLVYIVYDYVEKQWVYRSEIGIDDRDLTTRREATTRYDRLVRDRQEQF